MHALGECCHCFTRHRGRESAKKIVYNDTNVEVVPGISSTVQSRGEAADSSSSPSSSASSAPSASVSPSIELNRSPPSDGQ